MDIVLDILGGDIHTLFRAGRDSDIVNYGQGAVPEIRRPGEGVNSKKTMANFPSVYFIPLS